MTQLIDTIDSKKLYADRALKDANGKQIDTTYAETPVILRYGDAVTQTNEELTELFKQGRLYVLYQDTQLIQCKGINFGNAFAFIDETNSEHEVNQIFYNTGTSQWYQQTYDTYRVKTRAKNGAEGYLGNVMSAGDGISLSYDSNGKLLVTNTNSKLGIVVNVPPSKPIEQIIDMFYQDRTFAFDPTTTPIKTFAQVKAYPSENRVVYGRTDGTTRHEYTLTYVDGQFSWSHDEYELQTKLTFDSTPTSDSSNPVTSDGIKKALDAKQNDISAIIPSDASSTNQLASKAYADAIGERLEARYLGSDAAGNPFPTHTALVNATAYYYQGQEVTPDTNDITTVTADEDHVNESGVACVTRYRWNASNWAFEYVINNTGLNESQLLAVNSGITSAKVTKYDGYEQQIADAGKNVILTYGQTPTQTWDELIALADASRLYVEYGSTGRYQFWHHSSDVIQWANVNDLTTRVIELKKDMTWSQSYTTLQKAISTVGSVNRPVYFDNGTAKECGTLSGHVLSSSTATSGIYKILTLTDANKGGVIVSWVGHSGDFPLHGDLHLYAKDTTFASWRSYSYNMFYGSSDSLNVHKFYLALNESVLEVYVELKQNATFSWAPTASVPGMTYVNDRVDALPEGAIKLNNKVNATLPYWSLGSASKPVYFYNGVATVATDVATKADLIPTAPATGTYVLKSVNGTVQWVAE